MNADAAIESFFSWLRGSQYMTRPSLADAPVFMLGREIDLDAAIEPLREDLLPELRARIPIPYPEQFLFVQVNTPEEAIELLANEEERKIYRDVVARGLHASWCVTYVKRLTEANGISIIDFTYSKAGGWAAGTGGIARIAFSGLHAHVEELYPKAAAQSQLRGQKERAQNFLTTAWHIAMISHPANYIVKETPQLTTKEAKRVAQGKRFPEAKRPRYIILDHDILVGRLQPQGTHASPAPHQRRGHWMRLAEHCRHAKARGVEKVWVRDCKVGETDFVVNERRYQVLLDFQEKVRARIEPT